MVIVTHGYKERRGNIEVYKERLKDWVLVNNTGDPVGVENEVMMPFNLGPRAKFIAALMYPSEHYLFLDDDCYISEGKLKPYAMDGGVGVVGKRLGADYQSSKHYEDVKKEWEVDVLLRAYLLSYAGVLRYLELENFIKVIPWRTDDLMLGQANKLIVVPGKLEELGDGGVGLSREKEHLEERDEFVKKYARKRSAEIIKKD